METDKSDVLLHYATREDVQLVRVELQSVWGEIKALRAEIARLRSDVRADLFAALNAQTWKMVGLVLTLNIATVTAVYYIAR